MDEDPETIRQRGLDDAAETLQMLRQRQEEQRPHAPQGRAGEPEWVMPAPEPPKPVQRVPAPSQRPQQQPVGGVDWAATEVWVRGLASQQIKASLESFAEAIGEEAGRSQKQERESLRREFTAAVDAAKAELRAETAAAVAAARIADLERRLAETERAAPKPPPRPQLVGGSDGG